MSLSAISAKEDKKTNFSLAHGYGSTCTQFDDDDVLPLAELMTAVCAINWTGLQNISQYNKTNAMAISLGMLWSCNYSSSRMLIPLIIYLDAHLPRGNGP